MAGKAKKRERPNLTAKFCESVQPLDQIVEYYDGSSSLVLRVLPNGKKNWSMRYRSPNGKQRRFDFGEFPALTLADARTEFLEAKLLIKRGGDPAEQRREEKVAKAKKIDTLTVAELGARYLQAAEDGCHKAKVRRRKKQSSIDDERYWFDRFILPRLGKYRVDELNRHLIQNDINELIRTQSMSTPRRVAVTLHAMYSYAVWQELVSHNPCVNVSYPSPKSRKTALTDDQLRMVWSALTPPLNIPDIQVGDRMGYALQLAIVTGQRIGEIAQMRVSQINFDDATWLIPEEVTKNSRPHLVPLGPLALELIGKARSLQGEDAGDAIFASPRKHLESVHSKSVSHACRKIRLALGWPNIRPHDFRRTVATNMAKPPIKTLPYIVSKVLNHQSDKGGAASVTSVYNLWEYLDEKREALVAWEKRLRQILIVQAVIEGRKAG